MVTGLVQLLSVNVMLDIVQSLLMEDRFVKPKVNFFQCFCRIKICCFSAVTTCPPRSVGLVRYPTTLSPVSGSVTVITQCVDNAHVSNCTSLNVKCTSNGSWSGQIPRCQCDEGYQKVNGSGTQICEGEQYNKNDNHYSLYTIRLILFLCVLHTQV